jgi:hypothetical protein
MEKVIKKWELILQQDSDRDITYGRKVLEEMLIDVKQAVKNCSIPPIMPSLLPCGEVVCQNPHEKAYRGCDICKFKKQ